MSTPTQLPSILLVGCGKMGGAMLDGWLACGLPPSAVIDRHRDSLPAPHILVPSLDDLPADFQPDIIILAVKPQKADATLEILARRFARATLLSVMAGRSIASLSSVYTAAAKGTAPVFIRAMPNTPSTLGAGMTGPYAPHAATPEQKQQ